MLLAQHIAQPVFSYADLNSYSQWKHTTTQFSILWKINKPYKCRVKCLQFQLEINRGCSCVKNTLSKPLAIFFFFKFCVESVTTICLYVSKSYIGFIEKFQNFGNFPYQRVFFWFFFAFTISFVQNLFQERSLSMEKYVMQKTVFGFENIKIRVSAWICNGL